MTTSYKQFNMHTRNCPICGGSIADNLIQNSDVMRANVDTYYLFEVSLVVCKHCGFVYSSPCPTSESLEEYYSVSAPMFALEDAYDIKSRLDVISLFYSADQNVFVEIGGNSVGKFHGELKKMFKNVKSIEINSSCGAEAVSINNLQNHTEYADMVGLYYVLEHVPNINEIFRDTYQLLKSPEDFSKSQGGYMIVEVPNITEYAYDISGFALAEHVNHFSPYTLAILAAKHKFKLVYLSKSKCSRCFGFVAVFQKSNVPVENAQNGGVEYLWAIDNIACANEIYSRRSQNLVEIVTHIRDLVEGDKKIVFWCANSICEKIINKYVDQHGNFPANVMDSDINKKQYFSDWEIQVMMPQVGASHITESDEVIICSDVHYMKIAETIDGICAGQSLTKQTRVIYYVDSLYNLNRIY